MKFSIFFFQKYSILYFYSSDGQTNPSEQNTYIKHSSYACPNFASDLDLTNEPNQLYI